MARELTREEKRAIHKLVKSLLVTGAVSGSVKDPVWRYLWVKNHEPEKFRKVRWWLDVKEYIIGRMTGEFIMTEDSAWSTFLYDTRKKTRGWSSEICDLFDIDIKHLPPVIKTTDVAGKLREAQAAELGLAPYRDRSRLCEGRRDSHLLRHIRLGIDPCEEADSGYRQHDSGVCRSSPWTI